jgi:hypothetical protein
MVAGVEIRRMAMPPAIASVYGTTADGFELQFGTNHLRHFRSKLANVYQSAEMGALPQLYAATAANVRGGEFYGPGGFLQRAGYPKNLCCGWV